MSFITRYTPLRTVITIVSVLSWKLLQMNVKTTFFNDEPDGFIKYVAEESKHPQLGIS